MGQLLSYLPFLACPIGMGLMMWMMMRGGRQASSRPPLPSRRRWHRRTRPNSRSCGQNSTSGATRTGRIAAVLDAERPQGDARAAFMGGTSSFPHPLTGSTACPSTGVK